MQRAIITPIYLNRFSIEVIYFPIERSEFASRSSYLELAPFKSQFFNGRLRAVRILYFFREWNNVM